MSIESKLDNALAGLPLVLANAAVNWTLENFKRQGWENGRQPWPKRKRETAKTRGKPILVQSGRLRRAVQVVPMGGGQMGFGVLGVPYARIHNEGGQISQAARSETFVRNRYKRGPKAKMFKKGVTPGRGQTYKARVIGIPQRKFIGTSPALRQQLIQEARTYLKNNL